MHYPTLPSSYLSMRSLQDLSRHVRFYSNKRPASGSVTQCVWGEKMTTHSPDLQWQLIKNSSCFLVRRKYAKANTFTTVRSSPCSTSGKLPSFSLMQEPNNLTGKNSWKYNGLVNLKVCSSPLLLLLRIILSLSPSSDCRTNSRSRQ